MSEKGFVFLGDLIKLETKYPMELIEGHFINKANPTQVNIIKNNIENLGKAMGFVERYETVATKGENGGLLLKRLESNEWNYWIIEYSTLQIDPHLSTALCLSSVDLNPLFQIVYVDPTSGPGRICQYDYYSNFVRDCVSNFKTKFIGEAETMEIKEIYGLAKNFDTYKDKYQNISKALKDFEDLKIISKRTSFKIVGMFSIIEALITNNNGITQQLKSKLNLLNNRFEKKLDHNLYFKGPNNLAFEKVIEKLYTYRSDIAHGNWSDFRNELKVIADANQAYNFLYTLVKKLVVHSLKEPQLIKDLKMC